MQLVLLIYNLFSYSSLISCIGSFYLISNSSLGVCTRGDDLAECFRDNEMVLIEMMNFITECIRYDEKLRLPESRGSTVILSWTLGVC